MIEIDGAAGEGGGQLLRFAGAVHVHGPFPCAAPKPGLMRAGCVIAAAEIRRAVRSGAELNRNR